MSAGAPLGLAIVISGRGSNMLAIAHACLAGHVNARVLRVIADRDSARGIAAARELGLPVAVVPVKHYSSQAQFEQALGAEIEASGARIIALAGFMRILSAQLAANFAGRLLNIHPALLPKYKGLHTHQRVLDAGETEHGASVHYVTAELDGGPVILQGRVPVLAGDTADTLSARVQRQEHIIYPRVLGWLADGRLDWRDGRVYFDGRELASPLQSGALP